MLCSRFHIDDASALSSPTHFTLISHSRTTSSTHVKDATKLGTNHCCYKRCTARALLKTFWLLHLQLHSMLRPPAPSRSSSSLATSPHRRRVHDPRLHLGRPARPPRRGTLHRRRERRERLLLPRPHLPAPVEAIEHHRRINRRRRLRVDVGRRCESRCSRQVVGAERDGGGRMDGGQRDGCEQAVRVVGRS